MDLDQHLVSHLILGGGTVQSALEENLQLALLEGPARNIWKWLLEHFREHGVTPGEEAFTSRFTYTLKPITTESTSFYVAELRRRFAYNQVVAAMRNASAQIDRRDDPMKAVATLREAVQKVDEIGTSTRDIDWASTVGSRIDKYMELAAGDGVDGIPWPFPGLNVATQGRHGGELILVLAESGVGKTWFLVLCAYFDWLAGLTPVLFSKEMPAFQIARRIDALHSKLPYQRLRSGNLVVQDLARWQEQAADLAKETAPFPIIPDEGGGVSAIVGKLVRYEAASAFIDGGYLIEDDKGAFAGWERFGNVTRDLKRASKRLDIPIVMSAQLSADGDAAYFKGVKRDADLVLELRQDADQRHANRMTVLITKQREGQRGEFEIRWDLDGMNLEELVSITERDDPPMAF